MGDLATPRPRIRIERVGPADARLDTSNAVLEQCRLIRRRVFVDEQSVPPDLEWDGLDTESEHFAALGETPSSEGQPEQVLGTARLRCFDGFAKAERVAVLPWARRNGIGQRLMEAIEARARAHGLREVRLNAQVAVLPFYERLGYSRRGASFLEAGIEHVAMWKTLG